MGLAVVHGIMKSYSGTITVKSKQGKGSTFYVYLPRIERRVLPETQVSEPIPHGHERVLFIDDEPGLTEIGKQLLEHLGYDVTTRTSSIEALELFRAKPERFDLVITDMTMPHLTGEKLSQQFLKIRPDIPIILCTGYSENITEAQAKAMHIKAFAMKPLVLKILAKTVREVLDEA